MDTIFHGICIILVPTGSLVATYLIYEYLINRGRKNK